MTTMPSPASLAAALEDFFLTPEQLATRWQRDVGTLANDRCNGRGVPFVKLGTGAIRYRASDILAFEQAGASDPGLERALELLDAAAGLPVETRAALKAHFATAWRR